MSTVFVGAIIPENTEREKPEDQKIKRVHIRVFFDGTNNNAIQTSRYVRMKKKYIADFDYKGENNTVEELAKKKKTKEDKKKLFDINLHPGMDNERMHSDTAKGYSNVAVLYSLLAEKKDTSEDMYYDLYVEGSGSVDVSASGSMNINGLGFGLGNTGVTALVSKAVMDIHNRLTGLVSKFDANTEYHFYVFGFSRGATCGRLFSELATRDVGEILKREKEFGEKSSYCKNLVKKGRLPFMEPGFLGNLTIKRTNVTVDILGIYDTVASIGNIKQKSGWTNPLSFGYRPLWWSNYYGNFHYMNSADYGLYSPLVRRTRIKKVMHVGAGDEFRENFALVNLGKRILLNPNLLEIIIPGCHSDVGGGYIDEISAEAVIDMIHPREKGKNIRVKMFMTNPHNKYEKGEELNETTLNKLGWINTDKNAPVINKEGILKGSPYTVRYVENGKKLSLTSPLIGMGTPLKDSNNIKMKRAVLAGYSNIPLEMMIKFVRNYDTNNYCEFSTANPYDYKKTLQHEKALTSFGDKVVNFVTKGKSGRYWILPDNNYSGGFYRWLRLHYLHFTSSNRLFHTRVKAESEDGSPVKLDGSPGNFGNFINYDSQGRICRITYNGEKNYTSHTQDVNYMYDIEECTMVNISISPPTPESTVPL